MSPSSNGPKTVLSATIVLAALLTGPASALAETPSPDSGPAVHYETSPPLRSITPGRAVGKAFPARPTPPLPSAFLRTPAEDTSGTQSGAELGAQLTSPFIPSTTANFEGIAEGCQLPNGELCGPPDPSGAAGINQYVEVVNLKLAVYSKTGTVLLGPVPTNALWKGFGGGCENNNDGDPTVLFDTINQRWVIQQFSVSTTPYLDCVAVSSSSDATGSWHLYSFQYENFPDYPKMGIWPDGYYMSYNLFEGRFGGFIGSQVCALDRAAMLAGKAATQQCRIVGSASAGSSLLPATLDGSTPPSSGEPEWFVALSPTTANALAYWRFHVDWSNPANTTFTGPTNLPVQAFSQACGGGTCIPQSETTQQLASMGNRLMYRLAYRNFGDHEAMVVSHAVAAGASVGMRWYELRPSNGSLTVYQQGTYAPDSSYRWMGSIAMDMVGNMGLGYSVSSSSLNPQIRYTGRLVSDPLGTMPQGEGTIKAGAASQTGFHRWGDYSQMSIDPSDECTFWYVNEYHEAPGAANWRTRIGSFKFPDCGVPTATTETAAGISPTGAIFRGTINPRGAATKYRFEYGKTAPEAEPWEKSIPVPDGEVGSGTADVKLSQSVSGLTPGTQYAYRIVAITKTDTVYGFADVFTTSTQNWAVQSTPNPTNASASRLLANSCTSQSHCMSVGKYVNSSGTTVPLAERWDGTSWSIQSPPAPTGAVSSELSGVSCPSTALCVAVGSYKDSTGTAKMFTSTWNGTSWSNQTPPYPSGSSKAELAAVSCPTTTWCMAVGNYWGGPYQHPLAEVWNGSTWSVSATPLAGLALLGVSCTSTTFCMATGYQLYEGVKLTFAEKWTGTWTVTTTPNRKYATDNILSGVSCVSATSCKAVGSDKRSEVGIFQETLAEHWNGTSWNLIASPNGVNSASSALRAVSCTAESDCTAVGSYNDQGVTVTLAERWDGSAWRTQGTPNPSPTYNALFGVSCITGVLCTASGLYKNASGTEVTLVEKAEGPDYQPPTVATKPASSSARTVATLSGEITPNGLPTQYQFEYGTTTSYGSKAPASPKSIGSGTSPVEVGESIEGLQPETTYHFRLVATNAKGTTEGPDQTFTTPSWEILSTPNPSGATDSNLYDVSCEPSTSVCTAVGKSTVSGADRPVAQRWDGTSWSEQSPAKKSGTLPTRLFGVDCPSETRCLAAGNYQPSEGGPTLLTEIWNEGKWNVQSPPVPSEATSSELVAIGCNSTAQCRAAGSAVIGGVKTAIVEAWTSPNWTLQTIPIPEGAKSSQLDGIDCIWSSVCVAVGRYTTSGGSVKKLAMLWDGTSWSLQSLADPEGAVQTTLLDVSCTKSPTRCTAVGGWKNSAGEQFTLAYRFNGSTWTLQSTPNPSGATESVFQDVSCATETSCTAAGSSVGGGSTQTLAEKWNGTSWSIQGTSNPAGATFSGLFGVSCQSITCVGVGWSTDGSGVDTTLAETSDLSQPPTIGIKAVSDLAPTKATLKGTVNPNGSETTYQFEYGTTTSYGSKAPASPKSIGSGTSPVEVGESIEGLQPETTYHFRLVATNAKGTTKGSDQTFTTPSWAIVSTPNPSGATDSNLYDVSCEPSTSVCTAVGKSTVSGADIPVAQRWNGTTWSEQSPDKKSGTLPTRLFGVDCPSETRCLAAGNYQPAEGGPTLLTEIWNEGNWNVQTTPVPSGATSSELVAIGCSSTAQCTAVGSAMIGGVKTAIAERWLSPTWTLSSIPIPEGATSSQLDGVDCIWSNFCVAVGRYTSGGSTKALAMFWNEGWTLQTLPTPEGAVQSTLLDVSCTKTPSRCTAVGGWKNSAGEQFTLAYRFNGSSTWTLQSTPNPSGATESVLHGVSCATETSCAAVGSSVSGGTTKTVAENWNGTTWSIQGTSSPSGATFSSLFGVSCRSTTCMGVGWSTDGSGVDTTLAEIRE